MVEVAFLLICIDIICAILSQGVELHGVVKYRMVPFLQIQKFLQLATEQTHR
jgi:hypothetical protein